MRADAKLVALFDDERRNEDVSFRRIAEDALWREVQRILSSFAIGIVNGVMLIPFFAR